MSNISGNYIPHQLTTEHEYEHYLYKLHRLVRIYLLYFAPVPWATKPVYEQFLSFRERLRDNSPENVAKVTIYWLVQCATESPYAPDFICTPNSAALFRDVQRMSALLPNKKILLLH